jgi:hypothetical protein
LASAITLATFATGAAAFDASSWEVSGFVKNETSFLQKDGQFIGQATSATDNTDYNDQGDVTKFENTLKLFVNGDLSDNAALHAELNFVVDPEAEQTDYQSHVDYSQNDYLRELYVDAAFGEAGDVELRVGKQQVVWGTADGAKLLDIINPTDYRELAQNTMEDSRIPVWMAKLEMPAGESGSVQFVASQARENIFAGLDRDINTEVRGNNEATFADETSGGHATGNPYVMKGVDSITGQFNGFLNIAPDLGGVARRFAWGFGGIGNLDSALMSGFSVGGFQNLTMDQMGFALDANGAGDAGGAADYTELPANFQGAVEGLATQLGVAAGDVTGAQMLDLGFGSAYNTNLSSFTTTTARDSAFEYMDRATFRTFNAFVNAKSQYVYEMPDDLDLDYAFRFKDGLDNGLNYSFNYAYAYDKNPIINISWRDAAGNELAVVRSATFQVDTDGDFVADANTSTLSLAGHGGSAGEAATLRFEQTVERAHNIGSALDYTVDTESLGGVVLRGEFLYQKDVYSPIMDRGALSIGDLPAALTMQKGDRFKYVIGADITVLTNMLVSGQFIQDRNLDYVDQNVDFDGSTCAAGVANCGRYTTDYATMHLSNGFNKAEKNKNFYSLFLSKPFGPNQLGRWNNIFMYEENGGKWNRFDVEYSFTDEMIGLFELNNYWGDENTQFGQLEDSSSVQVGFKYLF